MNTILSGKEPLESRQGLLVSPLQLFFRTFLINRAGIGQCYRKYYKTIHVYCLVVFSLLDNTRPLFSRLEHFEYFFVL